MLTKEEGGRHTPFFKGYGAVYFRRPLTGNGVAGRCGDGDAGDNIQMTITLITRWRWTRGCASRSVKVAARWVPVW